MDRLKELRTGAEASGDATLDSSSLPSEAYMSANETSSKYFSLSDSTFDITPIKDVSLASAASAGDPDLPLTDPDELLSDLSPITKKDVMLDSFKIGKQIEAANILSGGVEIFEDNDNSFDGDELVIDDNVDMDDKSNLEDKSLLVEAVSEGTLVETHVDVARKDTEVVLQIDGKNVDAIDIGNGLYLYRKAGQEELAAVQIITEDNQQAPSFKFLKVRENIEGNLEVYEEFEIEVSKDAPVNIAKPLARKTPHVPIKNINKVISEASGNRTIQKKDKTPPKEVSLPKIEQESEKESSELNLNGKMMKYNESRKSPVVGSFTPMTYHSTPNKEGKPLTKTMVDQQLHPSRHSDNVKKTIEVHTDNQTKKLADDSNKQKLESQTKNTVSETTKDISTVNEIIVESMLENANKKDLIKEKGANSATSVAGTVKEIQKVDNAFLCKPVEAANLLLNYNEKEAGSSKVKEEDEKEISSTPIDSTVNISKDILNKNNIFACPIGHSTINQILKQDITKELNDSSLDKTDNISTKDGNNISVKDTKIIAHETTQKTNETNPALEKPKEIDQEEVKGTEKVLEINNLDRDTTEQSETVLQRKFNTSSNARSKESSGKSNVSSSLAETKTPIDIQKYPKSDKQPEEEKSTIETIPVVTKLETTLKDVEKEVNVADKVKETEQKPILEKEKSCLPAEITELCTKVLTEESVVEINKRDILKVPLVKVESKEVTQIEANQADNKIESKIAPNLDESNPKQNKTKPSDIEKLILVPESIAAKVDPKTDKVNIHAKPIELITATKIKKVASNIKVETKTTTEAVVLEKIQDPKTISVDMHAKSIEPITETKIEKVASNIKVETKTTTEAVVLEKIQDPKTISVNIHPKPIEPITATKLEKSTKIEKFAPNIKVETKTTSEAVMHEKIQDPKTISNKLIPVSKGAELKMSVKPVILNPTDKKSVPVSQTFKIIATPKANEPKTYSKTEKTIFPKGIEVISKSAVVNQSSKAFELKTVPKTVLLNPVPKGIVPKPAKIERVGTVVSKIPKSNAVVITSNEIIAPGNKADVETKTPETSNSDSKPINNNHAAVPFGKWTDANRQQFLNQFKEIKVPATSSTKQIKNSNDLNRIDVLKKIDSQRFNTSKAQDKSNIKNTMFSTNIAPPKVETKIPVKNEGLKVRVKPVDTDIILRPENTTETVTSSFDSNVISEVNVPEKEETREVNVSDLIGKAILGMLNRPVPKPMTRSPLDEPRHVDNKDIHISQAEKNTEQQNLNIDQHAQQKINTDQQKLKTDQQKLNTDQRKLKTDQRTVITDQQKLNIDQKLTIEQKIDEDSSGSLDDIEMKMNELHGIPFVERPPHELPRVHKTYSKSKDNPNKDSKKHLPATSKQSLVSENIIDLESEEEVIEHEPVTGDIDLTKKCVTKLAAPVKVNVAETKTQNKEPQKKETIITENDFDKFARRNSRTFEDCLTVKFDGKEPANVVQTVKEKDVKINSKDEIIRLESKTKLSQKSLSQINSNYPNTKFGTVPEDPSVKINKTKLNTAYHSAMTAKRQMDRPITIIEDKPVKVVFMDANTEFVPNQLNVQGKELSPSKKVTIESSKVNPLVVSSDVTEAVEDKQDEMKAKTKHQRKQVLTPVEAPDLELIQPSDLLLDVSPKKKRKTDDNKTEKTSKNLVHKKSYLLGRAGIDKTTSHQEVIPPVKETLIRAEIATERTVSAIDNLVKAAELLDNQAAHSHSPNPDSQQNTPVKRGRGRPRKYPLLDGANISVSKISPSPQKKPRLIDAKPVKQDPISDEDSSDEEQMIRENWTMGKINENIVCPICNKLFRSENVVFKHVKHCTGVSPTRSELEKRSPRRRRYSRDSDNKSFESQSDDMEFDEKHIEKTKATHKKRISKDTPSSKSDEVDVIVIEDTPVKEPTTVEESKSKANSDKSDIGPDLSKDKPKKLIEKPVKEQTLKDIADEKYKAKKLEEVNDKKDTEKKVNETMEDQPTKVKKMSKTVQQSNLVCEFCGKTFRQLSYLANHKLQHKKDQLKKLEAKLTAKLQVFSCEVCKKEFRKLHHLVQHRLIHNPEAPARTTRKSSSEQSDTKVKEQPAPKATEDASAGFRCEPCDKSFRKLHHLVEHRETHDGINRQKTNAQTVTQIIEKPPPPPQCDVCKKSFRKLHHLIEHKEQHHVEQVETNSEKSDDKSVQSSLSTRDIIHECSLCYMVFPNEHSHNKHFVICQQKKKRQSKAKDKSLNADGVDIVDDGAVTEDSMDINEEPEMIAKEENENKTIEQESKNEVPQKVKEKRDSEKPTDADKLSEVVKPMYVSEIPVLKEIEVPEISTPVKRDLPKSNSPDAKKVIPEKVKKIDDQAKEMPKKITIKDRIASPLTKRQKSLAPLPVLSEGKPVESSDDDDVKYMLNPNYKPDETSEGKVFMKVRSNKRNSLQIERPNSRDLMNRRTSLQHPLKIPRLKAKAVEPKVVPTVTKIVAKPLKIEAAATDSDDSDVKYSFPTKVSEPAPKVEIPKEKNTRSRTSLTEKRKSLSGIAKRKSLGQAIAKLKPSPSTVRIIKRRTLDVEHRCDCGQLFNSAALLTRHTSLAHTPPRIRRRRSPPPEPAVEPRKPANTRQASVRSEASNSKLTRKSSVKSDTPETRKSKAQEKPAKPRRTPAHRGVPVPEKMRKLMMKLAK